MAASQSVNEQLLDLNLRHAVTLSKYENSVVRKIISLLNEVDGDIVKQILKYDPNEVSGSYSRKRLEAMLRAIREISADGNRQLNTNLSDELKSFAKYEAGFQANLLTSAIPVAIDLVTPPAALLNQIVTTDPIKGRLLKEWTASLSADKYAKVSQAIRLGIVEGQTTPEIMQRVRGTRAMRFKDGILETTRASAEKLVRTAVADVASSVRNTIYEQNKDIVAKVQWVATLDGRTCVRCAALDGETFNLDEGPRPPLHISCRCSSVPVTKSFREMGIDLDEAPAGTRASMNGQVADSTTYESWLKKQSAEFQDDVLGVSKGALFRRGGLSLDKFTNRFNAELTLDELKVTESAAFKRANIAA